jgi:hypothetical protein
MAGREMVVNFPGSAPVLGQAKAVCGLVLASGANSERPANRQGCVRPKMATLKRPQHQRLMLQLHPICSTVRHSDTGTSDSSPVCTITNAYLSCHPNHGAAFERAHSSPFHLIHRVIRTNRDSVNVRSHLKSLAKHWTLCLSDEPYALQTFVMCPSLYRTSWYCGTRDCKLNLFQNENHMQINASTLHLSISRARPIREYIHWILQVHGIEYVYLSLRLGTSLRFQFVLPPPCPCIIENVSESRIPCARQSTIA